MERKKPLFLTIAFFAFVGGLYAQTSFPAGDFWSLDAGFGMSGILADGLSFQAILEPRLWLSPPLMVGSKLGVNYSAEDNSRESGILAFEGQVYLRWNFLRLGGNPDAKINIFAQLGLGLLAAYRGTESNPFDDATLTRGSLLADGALGVTIPLGARWHIEPSIRGGYPHIAGFSFTAGYKFPLPQKAKYSARTEYVEIIRMLPPTEIVKRIMISSVEYVLFGPDIGRYNVGIDRGAQELNEMVLNAAAGLLNDNPDLRVRIEGHANPATDDPNEADELMSLSAVRSNAVADALKERGVSDEQMIIISFGGTRNITDERDIRDRNRRVELIVIQVDADQN